INDFLDFAVFDHSPQAHRVHVMERNHYLQAVRIELQEVELCHSLANGPAADLFDNSNAMIGIDDLITYVEIAGDHEGTPTRTGQMRNCTTSILPQTGQRRQLRSGRRESDLRRRTSDVRPRTLDLGP